MCNPYGTEYHRGHPTKGYRCKSMPRETPNFVGVLECRDHPSGSFDRRWCDTWPSCGSASARRFKQVESFGSCPLKYGRVEAEVYEGGGETYRTSSRTRYTRKCYTALRALSHLLASTLEEILHHESRPCTTRYKKRKKGSRSGLSHPNLHA